MTVSDHHAVSLGSNRPLTPNASWLSPLHSTLSVVWSTQQICPTQRRATMRNIRSKWQLLRPGPPLPPMRLALSRRSFLTGGWRSGVGTVFSSEVDSEWRMVCFTCYSIGIRPVAIEDRTETHFIKIFFLWFSGNMNILSCVCFYYYLNCARKLWPTLWFFRRFTTGTLGPVTFGLGLRDSCLVILFFNLLCAVPPAYL